jgi:hypothetical protein
LWAVWRKLFTGIGGGFALIGAELAVTVGVILGKKFSAAGFHCFTCGLLLVLAELAVTVGVELGHHRFALLCHLGLAGFASCLALGFVEFAIAISIELGDHFGWDFARWAVTLFWAFALLSGGTDGTHGKCGEGGVEDTCFHDFDLVVGLLLIESAGGRPCLGHGTRGLKKGCAAV